MHIPPASDAVLSTPPQPPSPPSAPEHKPGEPSAQPLNPDSGSSTSSGGGVVPPSPYSRLRLSFLLAAVYTSVFLIALDQLIVSTAVPAITDEFGSLRDIGWYGSAYLLTSCSFQLVFGRVYTFYPVRPVYVVAILLFEVGSAICGAAGGSAVFIVGRGIQGVGAAGIYSGSVVGIVYAVPLHQRPIFMGLFGAVSGVASILGPLVGGAFTSNVTWRWCFYLNLPFGAVSILIIAIVLQKPLRKQQGAKQLDWKEKLSQLDVVGTLCLVPGVVSILLALQWGGSTYSWNDRRIIALLVLGGVLLVAFIVVQILTPETATVPSRIFKQRSIYSGAWVIFFIGGQMNVFLYFIPIWFQAIQGVSAVESGIRLLPFPLATIIASILVGIGATASGYYTPFLLLGSVLMAVGAGLLTTWQVHTSMSQWVGYQVLYGLGIGMGIQAPNLAAQTVLPLDDVATGTALMLFNQLLGGAIFVSVGQSVFTNGLVRHLSGVSGFDSSMVRNTGTEGLSSSVPPELKAQILVGYNEALRGSFQVGLILASLTIIGALGMQWRSVKSSQPSNSERREALDETVGNH
ncbi:putative MFS aflatoxin efflux pump [Xylariomycetidae sp. FL2044]|nr:putative MFS aflatoxin efflux pump [Xylariomycetidae sp. FL2044]